MKKLLLASTGLGVAVFGSLVWIMPFRKAPQPAVVVAGPVAAASEVSLDSTLLVTTGLVGAGSEEPLLAHTQGYVLGLFFSGGDYVRRGQVLVKLDNHTFVVAPHAGFVSSAQLNIGQYLTTKTVVTTLSKHNYLVVSVLLPASWPGSVHPGDSAWVWMKGRAPRMATGVVGTLTPSGPDTVVEIALPSPTSFHLGEQAYVRLLDTGPELATR